MRYAIKQAKLEAVLDTIKNEAELELMTSTEEITTAGMTTLVSRLAVDLALATTEGRS